MKHLILAAVVSLVPAAAFACDGMKDLSAENDLHMLTVPEVAKLTEAKDSSSLQVLDEAVVPIKKSKPKRAIIVILGTATAFFIGVFLAFFQEYFAKMSEEDKRRWEELRGMLFARKEKI